LKLNTAHPLPPPLQARAEYFELLEDAMTSPARLVKAFGAWRKHVTQTEVLGGLVGTA